MSIQLNINSEYEDLVPPLTDEEYRELKLSIQQHNKVYVPIVVNEDHYILDGHHRYKIADELNVTDYKTQVVSFKSQFDEKRFVIDANIKRRNLPPHEILNLIDKRREIDADESKQRQKDAGKFGEQGGRPKEDWAFLKEDSTIKKPLTSSDVTPKRKPRKKKTNKAINKKNRENTTKGRLSKKYGLSDSTQRRWDYVKAHGTPGQIDQMVKGWQSAGQIYAQIKHDERKQKAIEEARKTSIITDTGKRKLIEGDFTKAKVFNQIPDNSIDHIFTDPPYDEKSLYLYEDLGKLAYRVFKKGGSLVTYANHALLPDIFDKIKSSQMKFWWIFSEHGYISLARIHKQKIKVSWKPLLLFVKGDEPSIRTEYMVDAWSGRQGDKSDETGHPKGCSQSLDTAEHIINHFTVKEQTVLDPMFGGGTTGVAALKLGRRFIGIEKDTDTFKIGGKNIGN